MEKSQVLNVHVHFFHAKLIPKYLSTGWVETFPCCWIFRKRFVSPQIFTNPGAPGRSPLEGSFVTFATCQSKSGIYRKRSGWWFQMFFPTCQVRVVRFYVSLFFSSFSFSSASSSVSLSCCDSVCSVWHVGPQLRSCEFCVACWTSTAILWVQCGVPDPNRDSASSVWRTGPQPRSCQFGVACRTPTAILRVQCGVPDPNCDLVCSVLCAGPELRFCEFSVAYRTSTAIMRKWRNGASCRQRSPGSRSRMANP